ncbi:ABC transporter substrate-binding protein [Brachybacterium sp. UMB0905]|uniref:ABC transporter substrate-binding protein n=1 Tax=Brachybacterium sp. UMB0905 TaxID=2069310 RepID=UPI000C80C74B|nr:ABC transporter substrate-binding protein [Brachybacterium sp. UMB0905]PMC74718.1 transcriptional initiation protein Tat [Brachybacterium sp. UMB0905]
MISSNISRRGVLGALGIGAVSTAAVACSGGKGGSGGSDNGGGEGGGLFVIGTGVTATNQFAKNFNRYGGGDTAPGLDLVYEPLFRLSSKDGGQLLPMLAESAEHSEDGKEVTYHLRKGVTWSDGEPFTSKDVLFTLGSIYGKPNPKPAEDEFVWLSDPIETPDEHTVIVKYNSDQRQQEVNLALYYPIVPAHVYQDGDKLEFPQDIMDNPVGTGPATLESFDTQLVTYTMRDDYWGGTSQVGEVQFVPSGQAGNIETEITKGNVDFAEGGAPGVVNGFADQAETNHYSFIADGASQGIIFMTARPESPMADVNVRKAFRAAIDYAAVMEASGIGYTLPNAAGVDPILNESLQQPEFNSPMELDAEGAKAALEESGWTVNDQGNLEKDGKEHKLLLNIQNDNATFMVTMPIVVSNWEEHLGVKVTFDPKPKDVMDTILATGEFDIVASGLGYPGSPWSNYTMYDQPVKPIEEETNNGNWGRWEWGEEAETKMQILVSTLNTPETQDQIAEGVQGVQQAFLEQAPHAPVQGGGTGVMYSTINWTGFPDPADVDYFPRVGGMGNLTNLLMAIKPA